jgi:acyl-CoA thioesterase-1
MLTFAFQKILRSFFISLFVFVSLSISAFSSNAYSASKTILVLGDSLSAEYGLVRGTGWVSLLEKKLASEKITSKLINASISGETTIGGRSRLPSLLKQYKPNIIIIELGGNDALRGLDLKASEKNFLDMIQMAQSNRTQVLLLAMKIPPNYGKQYTDQFFSLYAKLSKETKSSLVPFFLEGIAENPALFQADRIHPKAEAHPVMLNNVWPHLLAMLKK